MSLIQKNYPFVSVCTPTFNRRPFIKTMFECFKNQTYPKDKIEWIIIDDGTDKIKDLVDESNIPEIMYYPIEEKMKLGKKRNFMHSKCSVSIIVYMDDDDYYPPERISHAVEKLTENKDVLCGGSSEIYVYFKHINKMYQGGPYNKNHATAGTFAFKKELLSMTKYNDDACVAEEKEFLKNYTIPFVQFDSLKTILVFSHIHNSFDKKTLLKNPNHLFKESYKTINMFIKNDYEHNIKRFFLNDVESLLNDYKPGLPENKPDVIENIKKIEDERKKMENAKPVITIQKEGEPPRQMTAQEIIGTLQAQQQKIKELQNTPYYTELEKREKKINILENLLKKLKEENENKNIEIKDLQYNINKTNNNKLDNTNSLQKELEEKNQKIKELEQLNNTQNVHFNFNKETQTSNEINNTQSLTKLIHSKIIPEIPITV